MVPANVSSVDEALRELARHDASPGTAPVVAAIEAGAGAELADRACEHRLACALVDVLERGDLPVSGNLAEVVADDRLMRLQVMAALRRAAGALDDAGIAWLTFKGPVIASLMPRPELRSYNDLDLLVPADRLEAAINVLVGVGIEEINENWVPYVRYRVGEVPMVTGSVSVDLHWHVVGLGRHRRSIRFDPTAMLARRRTVEISGAPSPTFDAVDQLLHLAVHAALSGASRLDQLRDLAVAVAHDPIDWDEFARRAGDVGVARLVAHALDRAGQVLGAPVDEAALRSMAGGSLERRRRLDGRAVGGLRGVGVRWRRDRPIDSLRAATGRLADTVRRGPGRTRGWDFVDEDSRLYHARPSGGAAARADYLRRAREWL